jgi:predicted phage terminase large subunit-like protein
MHRTVNGKLIVSDVKRGQWATEERERIIRETAEVDGQNVQIYYEQEPGSGGKESAEATTRNLLGYSANPDKPSGDKIFRADPFSVQVNNGNVLLLRGEWNHDYVEEFRFFPFSTYKDQVDASSGGFSKLVAKREARVIGSSR